MSDPIEAARHKIELRYHEYAKRHSKGNQAFYRRMIKRGWDAYEEHFGEEHPEKLWDDYESKGIVVSSDKVACIRTAWMLINVEMDLFRDLKLPKLPPPRAWFMWPVPDDVSLFVEANYPMSRFAERPTLRQTKLWMEECLSAKQ